MKDEDPTRRQAQEPTATSGGRHLVIVAPQSVQSIPLLGEGSVTIGRTDRSMVVIEDALLSREHLRIIWSSTVEVEDLGSANGTFVDDTRLQPRTPTLVRPGQPISLGQTILLLQEPSRIPQMRVLETHEAFESILAHACERAERGVRLSVLRVHIQGSATERDIHDVLTQPLAADDAIASYGPGAFEVLLGRADVAAAESLAGRWEAETTKLGLVIRVGIATFPQDGRTADALLDRASPRDTLATDASHPVFLSEQTRSITRLLERIAQGTISVLLQGETGVGKDVFAEFLHHHSPRAKAPFVRINCAALSDSLLESELFGYCKGAFTGAHSDRAGLLESAQGGTVFLDELGEMPLHHQAALLVAVERRQVVRVGSTKPIPIDVRFVGATNRNLEQEVAQRRFRIDLLHRLNGVVVDIPPLRERVSEIIPLAETFLRTLAVAAGRAIPPPAFTSEALALLKEYQWPGNIRELRNVVERALLVAPDACIDVQHLPLGKLRTGWRAAAMQAAEGEALMVPMSESDRAERARMVDALRQTQGNQTQAAALIGVPRRTFTHRMNRFGLRGLLGTFG